jgi:hypothetical protein
MNFYLRIVFSHLVSSRLVSYLFLSISRIYSRTRIEGGGEAAVDVV